MVEAIFRSLHLPTKAEVLWEHGKIISERKLTSHIVTLYSVFAFYAEVYCDLDFNVIEDIRILSHEEYKEFYNDI
ncbi:MAG: hypothetical protein JST87_01525 [Bacteroidetes bacterium]|nr:hypothetical protein [Bacteroidota bacterium]